jgi:hypothetical protein
MADVAFDILEGKLRVNIVGVVVRMWFKGVVFELSFLFLK